MLSEAFSEISSGNRHAKEYGRIYLDPTKNGNELIIEFMDSNR